jgi:hypothetical protein
MGKPLTAAGPNFLVTFGYVSLRLVAKNGQLS